MQQATAAPPGTAARYQWRCHHPVADHPEYGGGIRRLSHGPDLYPLHTRWKLQQQIAVALPRATSVPPGHGAEADAALCGLARVWRACVSGGSHARRRYACEPRGVQYMSRRRAKQPQKRIYTPTNETHLPPRSTVFPHRSRVARLHWRRASPTPTPYRHPLARGVSAAAMGLLPSARASPRQFASVKGRDCYRGWREYYDIDTGDTGAPSHPPCCGVCDTCEKDGLAGI